MVSVHSAELKRCDFVWTPSSFTKTLASFSTVLSNEICLHTLVLTLFALNTSLYEQNSAVRVGHCRHLDCFHYGLLPVLNFPHHALLYICVDDTLKQPSGYTLLIGESAVTNNAF